MFKLDGVYLTILEQMFARKDEQDKQDLAAVFHEVVGTIVALANPLSIISLASLFGIEKDDVGGKLDLLEHYYKHSTERRSSSEIATSIL